MNKKIILGLIAVFCLGAGASAQTWWLGSPHPGMSTDDAAWRIVERQAQSGNNSSNSTNTSNNQTIQTNAKLTWVYTYREWVVDGNAANGGSMGGSYQQGHYETMNTAFSCQAEYKNKTIKVYKSCFEDGKDKFIKKVKGAKFSRWDLTYDNKTTKDIKATYKQDGNLYVYTLN